MRPTWTTFGLGLALALALAACGDKKGDDPKARSAQEYADKSKTLEAQISLKTIYTGARMYYEYEMVGADGTALPRQFPASVGPTPPVGSCCQAGKPVPCAANATLWAGPSWRALKFALEEPSRYSYELKSAGTGADASFSARAYGDLDCDGVYSTFEVVGTVGPDGQLRPAEVTKTNELE